MVLDTFHLSVLSFYQKKELVNHLNYKVFFESPL
jgi:hypothetical protein